ncbi:MAG TPA: hypothetical protein VD963_10635 [Phycisphaerales bacterium]|nr:hypothetical protein [Phycisphaerales bacterium]
MAGISSKRRVGLLAAASVAALAGQALGQQLCQVSTGPDVIVGDITGPANYTAAGGLDALSLGTTSCNIGNVWLNWFANTNQHPVIGGNLYRYKVVDGAPRFEQVGMSWLKHGFFALSQTLCCSNCSSTNGQHLGVGCSDPYTAGRNGEQPNLGPRWQVNATTGVFTYPPANPSYSGTTARRLQVSMDDLENTAGSTTRYFGESQYVSPDDATANNQHNNASFREITVSGTSTNRTFAFATTPPFNTTQRRKAAIEAWKLIDPEVVETPVIIDGKFIVSSRAFDLGNGMWRYEYAVYNMNSDRSGQAFSVPVPADSVVTNIGFHDVDYRNGDGPGNANFSGADWTGTRTSNEVSWATQTFAENASANALRWGTTYNFRFDTNVPPADTTGEITLTTFKAPADFAVAAVVPAGTIPCPADWDDNDVVNTSDISLYLNDWFNDIATSNTVADFDHNGVTNTSDLSQFLSTWFAALSGNC